MPQPNFPIETPRLLLRPFEEGDLDALYVMQSREDVTRYLPYGPRSRAEVIEVLKYLGGLTAIDEENDSLRVAGVLRDTGALIGDYSLWRRSREHRQGEIGYVTHPDHQGRGYAVEACSALLGIGFEVAGLHRIVANADARNDASVRVMERLGMRREAHFRQNEYPKDEWTDEVVYAILAEEWRKRRR